jgi:Arc-like DNA binding dprotein
MARKQTDTVQLKLRFPERLRRRIEAAAERNERSLNGEIVHRLELSFEKDDRVQLVETTANAVAATMSKQHAGDLQKAFRRWADEVLAEARKAVNERAGQSGHQ